jgi:2,3-dihydroxybenzoate-AMP ligase
LYSVRGSAEICALTPDDVMYIAIPAAHNYPYSSPGALGMWHAGGTVVLSESPDPDACLPGLLATGATIVPLVPAVAHLWLMAQESAPRAFPRLRLIQVGGAKLSRDIALSIERVFETRVQQVFGMAEGLVNYTRLDDDQFTRTTTQGRRISPDDEVRIVDDSDIDVPMGADGHLITRGPYTIRGYYRNPDADDASFTEDGWYRTGDIARLDERGYLTVTGRAKAVINRGGEKIAPEEVEFHLHAHPEIVDAVVIGIDDDVLGERTRALVVARRQEEISVREVRGWLRDRGLAAFKVPDQVRFVDRLERTGVGKNRRPSRTAAAQMTTGETR